MAIEAMARALMASCHTYPQRAKVHISYGQARHMAQAALNALIDSLPDDAVEAGARAAYEANPTLASVKDLVPIIGPSITAALQHVAGTYLQKMQISPDPVAVAGGLSEAMRAKLIEIGDGQPVDYARGGVGFALKRRGLVFVNQLGARDLTDHGHAVRRVIAGGEG